MVCRSFVVADLVIPSYRGRTADFLSARQGFRGSPFPPPPLCVVSFSNPGEERNFPSSPLLSPRDRPDMRMKSGPPPNHDPRTKSPYQQPSRRSSMAALRKEVWKRHINPCPKRPHTLALKLQSGHAPKLAFSRRYRVFPSFTDRPIAPPEHKNFPVVFQADSRQQREPHKAPFPPHHPPLHKEKST